MSDLPESQITLNMQKVLQAFIDATPKELSAGDLIKGFEFPNGSLYPMLIQLEERGWLLSRESSEASEAPQLRLYRLTDGGRRTYAGWLADHSPLAMNGGATPQASSPSAISADSDRRAQQAFSRFLQMDPKPSLQETHQLLSQESRKLFSVSEAERNLLAEAIRALPEHQRRTIKLHLSGMSYRQIAQQAGEPSERIFEDLADAYAKLRLRLF